MKRMEGIEAARAFVDKGYPDCAAALLCGSVARGEATPSSDLDIIVVSNEEIQFYRKSFREFGWIIEAFVGSKNFNEEKIHHPRTNRIPSFLTSWAEGIILKDQNDFALSLKERAIAILKQGPHPLTQQDIDLYRYIITDLLDDFGDSNSYGEDIFILPELVTKSAELLLVNNGQWIGEKKWLYRSLKKSEDEMARQLISELQHFYKTGDKNKIAAVIESILAMVGGKLNEGFSKLG